MRWTRHFLIVLALFSLGCARGDWTDTLILVNVTGAWEGRFRVDAYRMERTIRWVLQQTGAKVTGEVQGADGRPIGPIQGLVKGEVFSWRLTGPFISLNSMGYTSSRSYDSETPIINDEMSGRVDGQGCPCSLLLRRVAADTIRREKKAQ